jgi:hypothetical protein
MSNINISNAYLNSELRNVEVYMCQPKGFNNCNGTWVAHLLKGLYGLKQGGCKWFKRLEEVLLQLGFSCIRADGSIFIWANNDVRVICPVFVDNITFASKFKAKIAELKAAIAQHFKLRNLGPTTFQLGVEITRKRSQRTLHLLQRRYMQDLLERYGFVDSSPVSTPMDPNVSLTSAHAPLTPEDEAFMCTVPYVSAVSALMYLAIGTRLDIGFAVGVLCCFMAHPGPEHWKAVKHLFRYLCGTIDYHLTYAPDASAPKPFYAYSDTDHSGNHNNGCSTSACCQDWFWCHLVDVALAAHHCAVHYGGCVHCCSLCGSGSCLDAPAAWRAWILDCGPFTLASGQPVCNSDWQEPRAPRTHEAP